MKVEEVTKTLTEMRDDLKGLTAPSYVRDYTALSAAIDLFDAISKNYYQCMTCKEYYDIKSICYEDEYDGICSSWEWRGKELVESNPFKPLTKYGWHEDGFYVDGILVEKRQVNPYAEESKTQAKESEVKQ